MSQLSDKVKEAIQKLFDHAPNMLQDDEIKLLRYHQLIAQEEIDEPDEDDQWIKKEEEENKEKYPVTCFDEFECPDYVETDPEFINNNRLRSYSKYYSYDIFFNVTEKKGIIVYDILKNRGAIDTIDKVSVLREMKHGNMKFDFVLHV
jgi:hypothetical protein